MMHGFISLLTSTYLLTAYIGYLLYFTFLKNSRFVMNFSLANHLLGTIFSVLAILTGYGATHISYIMVKAPGFILFLHKWISLLTFLIVIGSFVYMWVKQSDAKRIFGILIGATGFFFTFLSMFLGLYLIFDFVAR